MISDIREIPQAQTRAYDIEAEAIKIKIGTLTIEATRDGEGVLSVFGTKILFDGREPAFGITRIELVGDVNDDKPWQVKIHGYPRERK